MARDDCSFASQVAAARAELALTQQQLASELGVSFATVNRWENSKTEPSKLARQRFLEFCEKMATRSNVQCLKAASFRGRQHGTV